MHARGGEQNRGVVFGNDGRAGNQRMALFLHEVQKQGAKIVRSLDVRIHVKSLLNEE